MELDELEAEVALLLNEMETKIEGRHELYLRLREKMNELSAFGMPVPDDIKVLIEGLEAEFAAETAASDKR